MALGVSKVWGSAGMGAWQVWGSGGLVERTCEEKGRTKSTKGTKKSAKGKNKIRKRKLKSGNGERRPQKSVQEVLRGSQYDEKYSFFAVLAILGGVRGRLTESGL